MDNKNGTEGVPKVINLLTILINVDHINNDRQQETKKILLKRTRNH